MFKKYSIFLLLFIFTTSCSYTLKVKSGDEAFELKQFHTALQYYLADFKNTDDQQKQAGIAFKIGQCYKKKAEYPQSLRWFKKAYDLEYGLSALEQYAFALKQNEEYEAAIVAFNQLEEEMKQNNRFRREISICKLSLGWKQKKGNYQFIVKPATELNSNSSDYASVYHPDHSIHFVSDRDLSKENYTWTGRAFTNLFEFKPDVGHAPLLLPYPIQSSDNEGPNSIHSSGNEMYFTRCMSTGPKDEYCHIFYTKNTNDSWSEPEPLEINKDQTNTIHPALHMNGKYLVFSSDRPGGKGKLDLYFTYKTTDGWTEPIPFPEGINTEGNENFPIWRKDSLYFSSDYIAGMGGLDIFQTFLLEDSSWAAPYHMDWPVNSGSDDFMLSHDPTFVSNDSIRSKGCFSSNRNSATKDDIFYFEEKVRKEVRVKPPADSNFSYTVFIHFNFVESEKYNEFLSEQKKLDSVFVYINEDPKPLFTANQSVLKLKLLEGESYQFRFSKKMYLHQKMDLQTLAKPDSLKKDSSFVYIFKVELTPFQFNEEFVLQNVYYDYDKWDIRNDAKPSLDQLAQLLFANPKLNIRISSHTDCRGDDSYNVNLSAKRGNSCIDYLVNKGIEKERLFIESKGEQDLAIPCRCEDCIETEHQLNRRTTFAFIR